MRIFVLGFLMLVMLTPSLTCAAAVCAAMDEPEQGGQDVPCHDMESGNSTDTDNALMFFKDCSGVDLAQVHHDITVKKPDIKIDTVFFAWADISPEYGFVPVDAHQIRGPPLETAKSPSYPSLYLTTQRLRI